MAKRNDSLRPARTGWRYAAALAVVLAVCLLIAADGRRRAARLVPLEVVHHAAEPTIAPTIEPTVEPAAEPTPASVTFVLNTSTHRFHRPDCSSVQDMKEKNRRDFTGPREDALAEGYKPCGRCNP